MTKTKILIQYFKINYTKSPLFVITLEKKHHLRYNNSTCRCGEMADTLDSGSSGKPCGFKSRHLHH